MKKNITTIILFLLVLGTAHTAFAEKINSANIEISSPTNPDQNKWYSNQSATFNWKSSDEIVGTSVEFDGNPSTVPDSVSEGILYSKSYEYIGSGVWYFHLRLQTKSGWSNVSRFKIQIDRKDPEDFDIRTDNGGDATLPNPSLYFEAKDDLSGISRYRIKIDGEEISSVSEEEINPLVMPIQPPGLRKIEIIAEDKAGNAKEAFAEISIESIPAPEILIRPAVYNAGEEVLYVTGRTLPNSIVSVFLTKDEDLVKSWEAASDKDGSWSLYDDELFPNGIYAISAKSKDQRGAISDFSKEYEIKVALSGIAFGSLLIDFGSLVIFLILLLIASLIIIVHIFYKIRKERKKIWEETKEAELNLKKTFKDLRADLEKRIEYFDSRPGLSARERKIRDSVFKILRDSERIMEKEIRDIERETRGAD